LCSSSSLSRWKAEREVEVEGESGIAST
jgi:hypothetical protein